MLGRHGVEHLLLDANVEGILHLLHRIVPTEKLNDKWSKRAFRNRARNLSSMRDPALYRSIDRYSRAVKDLNRIIGRTSTSGAKIGLANFEHEKLSPLRSSDLLTVAEKPELSPFYPYFRSRLEGLFLNNEPSFVGISLNYLSQALCAFSIAGFIKKQFPKLKIIMGGGLVTSWLKNPQWNNPFSVLVDHLVAGPGEQQLLSLLGLNTIQKELQKPEYLSLPGDDYFSPGFILPYSASTGCYWNRCDFCPEKAEGNPYVPIPAQQVITDLKDLAEKTDPALIHLLDNAISPALLDAFTAESIGVPWYGFTRISPHLSDPDFCIALKQAGCVMLKLGIESGDQDVLDRLQKGITVEKASVVLRNLKKAGIGTYVYLIFGTPAETEAGARKTLAFTVKHRDSINFLNLAIFNMPICGAPDPGIETRSFYDGDLSLYTDFIHPAGWDRKRVRLFLDNEFRRHPAVSAILKNNPPVFTSNHAPFFVMGKNIQVALRMKS
jgi:Radical SAM superfamily